MRGTFDVRRYADLKIADDDAGGDIISQVAWMMRAPVGLLAKLHFDDKATTIPGLFQVYASGWGETGCLLKNFVESGQSARARTPEGRPVIGAYIVGACPGTAPMHVPADSAIIQIVGESAYRTPEQAAATQAARQPDINLPQGRYRWYDVAGTGDRSAGDLPRFSIAAFQMGAAAKDTACPAPGAGAPGMRYFARAILADLDKWVRVGGYAPAGAVFETNADHSVRHDDNGYPLGGIRGYWVDVPLARIAYQADDPASGHCGEPAAPPAKERASKLYKDRADYVTKLTDDLIKLVNGNYMWAADSDRVIAEAKAQ
jgi:hypothetical protein